MRPNLLLSLHYKSPSNIKRSAKRLILHLYKMIDLAKQKVIQQRRENSEISNEHTNDTFGKSESTEES